MFPFDEPAPTAFYLVLYLGTMVLHVVPMSYVLAGSGLLATLAGWETFAKKPLSAHAPIAAALRDWPPLALSLAITAGVAPLLFLQVLYKEPFYTANLLLFHRWMMIVPLLILAFYLLYVQKLKSVAEGPAWRRLIVATGVLACFAFVAWAWTENHLLGLRGQRVWVEQYASGRFFYGDWELPPRLALWCCGAVTNLAVLLGWQTARRNEAGHAASGPLARLATVGLGAGLIAGIVYGVCLPAEARGELLGRGAPCVAAAALGFGLQAWGWLTALRGAALSTGLLAAVTAGALLTTTGVTALREIRRLAEIDITAHYATHAQAAGVGGLGVFVFFLLANAALIAWVLVLARSGNRQEHGAGEF